MFGEERKAQILQLIETQQRVDVQALCEQFQVSESTVRRDLREMEEAGLLRRTHGGAISLKNVNFELSFSEKEIAYMNEKKAIAKKAAALIRDGETVLLDSGTTTHCLLREIGSALTKLTIVTNSLMLPRDFKLPPGIEVIVLGGVFRPDVLSLVGPFAEACLGMIKVDKAFMATNGFDLKEGLTTPNILEADIKRKMMKRAETVILLADSSKANQISFSRFAAWEDVDTFITDTGIPGEFIDGLEALGVEVCVVDPRKEEGTS